MDYASQLLSFLPGGRRAPGIGQLLSKLETYLPATQVERVQEAYELANESHKGQKRMTGELVADRERFQRKIPAQRIVGGGDDGSDGHGRVHADLS